MPVSLVALADMNGSGYLIEVQVSIKKKKTKTLLDQLSISGGCFFAGILCFLYGSSYQGELLGNGSAAIGRNSAYATVTGRDAQININFFWIGAAVFFCAALIQLIITVHREFNNPLPFGDSERIMICPKCKEPFSLENLEKAECPDCQVGLVQLKGFFDK